MWSTYIYIYSIPGVYTDITVLVAYLDHAVLQYSAVVEGPGRNRRYRELHVVSVGPQRDGGEEVAHVPRGEADIDGPRDAGSTVKVSPPALFTRKRYIPDHWGAGRGCAGRGTGDGGWAVEGVRRRDKV